ncbi:hypothetical protein EV401DRAFT_2043703 [Pisolithus croceorrhizus]|nr:hypothetical protein EV401DRAFT_2043703 [Pisolithus croceorrhizus]
MAAVPLAEVLITVSLCVLFHDSGSASAFPRTERLLSTHHLYCQPVFVDFTSRHRRTRHRLLTCYAMPMPL